MSPGERRALVLLLALAVAGHAVRLVATRPGESPGEIELVRVLPGQSPLAHKDSIIALARPLEPGERVDLDRAGPEEIARLPRVGPGLAKRIVADREARGPFGSLRGLDRVPGVGTALLAAIGEHVSFGGRAGGQAGGQGTEPGSLCGTGDPGAAAALSTPPAPPACLPDRLSLNAATAQELEALPGLGPKRAQAIVRDRERNGPFPSVEALARVPGIKPALVARVRHRLQVP